MAKLSFPKLFRFWGKNTKIQLLELLNYLQEKDALFKNYTQNLSGITLLINLPRKPDFQFHI